MDRQIRQACPSARVIVFRPGGQAIIASPGAAGLAESPAVNDDLRTAAQPNPALTAMMSLDIGGTTTIEH